MGLKALDIMTRNLITVSDETSLLKTLDLMSEHRIRHMPVVDKHLKVVGIVSQRDLHMSFPAIFDASEAPIKLFMTSPVKYLAQETPIRNVIFKLLENKISSVMVGNDQDDAVGIITTDDILWFFAEALKDESEKNRSFWDFASKQTIGELTRKLSDTVI